MWSYYGRKSKIIKKYPKPLHDTIIEPFAGTAVYSLHEDNWKKNIILVDKYEVITRIWKYLQQANPKDILKLPDMSYGDKVTNYQFLLDEEKWLIGFCINRGSARPKITASNYNSWNRSKIKIANNLYKIRHWKVIHGSYNQLENLPATWFIDPPYQGKGFYYENCGINYNHLSNWCKERLGQVIVCENEGADWLPFKKLTDFNGIRNTKSTEVIWYKEG